MALCGSSLLARANELVSYAAGANNNTTNLGSFTPSVYTSAWVALVRERNQRGALLAFPDCFQYVLNKQESHGGWQSGGLHFDNIMDTMAGLLALIKNKDVALSLPQQNVEAKISGATLCLEQYLENWDIASCDHVGFEVLMPTMLELLADEGVHFKFPARDQLINLREVKVRKLNKLVWWSGKTQTPITHSLEGFVGKVDFSELGQQKIDGSLGNSPSSTAAYLMYSKEWDLDAEDHLRRLLKSSALSEPGGVPVAYPTTGFETLWIVSTLLQNGFKATDFVDVRAISNIVEEYYHCLDGLASGFSKYGVPDADDTAKSIILQNQLGHPTLPDRLIQRFGGPECIRTYDLERTASVTTNCHALLAILSCPKPENYVDQIQRLVKFLCSSWTRSDVPSTDKWNNSEFYPMMLLSEALVEFLYAVDRLKFQSRNCLTNFDQPCLVLLQILIKTLQYQKQDGSWGPDSSREITAYAIIALSSLISLPFLPKALKDETAAAIEHGRSFLASNVGHSKVEKHWVDKTSFSPVNVSKAYIVAAEKVFYPKQSFGTQLTEMLSLPAKKLEGLVSLYVNFPYLAQHPLWTIQGSVFESHFHLQKLQKFEKDIFSREGSKADKYITFIALNLTCTNNLQRLFIKSDLLFELMVIVLRIYHIDEFVEHTIAKTSGHAVNRVKDVIDDVFEEFQIESQPNASDAVLHANGIVKSGTIDIVESTDDNVLLAYRSSLKAVVSSILSNKHVQSSSKYNRTVLRSELQVCLQAHVQQIIDSRECYETDQIDKVWLPSGATFHTWLRTAGSAHSCSRLMLAFQRCLLKQADETNDTAEKLYLIQDLWMHMSNKARLENDLASLRRDRKEQNLNSLDFYEFRSLSESEAFKQVTRLIEYEKVCCEHAFEKLQRAENGHGTTRSGILQDSQVLRFQYFFSNLYSDLYTVKDVSSEVSSLPQNSSLSNISIASSRTSTLTSSPPLSEPLTNGLSRKHPNGHSQPEISLDRWKAVEWTADQEKIILGPYDYLVAHPGKDFRSALVHAFNVFLSVPPSSLNVITKVIGMLHTSSLLIDDVQDGSILRRGVPVAHNIFGTAQTINSANYVYFLAMHELHKLERRDEAMHIFTSELLNLHRGQGMDLYWRDSMTCPSEDDYLGMVQNKTGGLFRLAVKLMQIESPARDSIDCIPLVNLMGLTFQICDDYLNLSSGVYTQNKGLCEDLTEGKFSFPVIHSIRADPRNLQLINILKQKTKDEEVKRYAVNYMESTGSFEYSRKVVRELCAKAFALIDQMDAGTGKGLGLRKIIDCMNIEKPNQEQPT